MERQLYPFGVNPYYSPGGIYGPGYGGYYNYPFGVPDAYGYYDYDYGRNLGLLLPFLLLPLILD